MIVMNVTYTMKDGKKAQDFLGELESQGLAPFSRNEKGNHCYRYYFPADGENQLFLLEKWEDEECLKAHKETENFAKIGLVKEEYVVKTDIERFVV